MIFRITKVIFASLLVMSSYLGFSQSTEDVSVEKSVFGIQVGLIGIWAHNELKLSNQVALRSEIAMAGINSAHIRPLLALEPRWYYNLDERAESGKRIDGNSGNYVSFRTSYQFYTTADAEEHEINQLLFAPTWGIRRNIGNHFNFEAGAGAGLGYQTEIVLALYVNLRIGYRF